MIDLQKLQDELLASEALRLKPYTDTVGKLTIGIGRNLDDNGISEDEAFMLLQNDVKRTISECEKAFSTFWFQLNDERKHVVICMVFNLGMPRFKKFEKLITAMAKRNFREAASEMLNSVWASQVKQRAVRLANIMKTGTFTEDQISD